MTDNSTLSVPINILILEDHPADVELLLHEIKRAGFSANWKTVVTEKEYLNSLDDSLDVILADFTLPQFDALNALKKLQNRKLDIPFIVVSGTISEEVAVECMKLGAADYLLKDRLTRLGPAISHALEQKRLRDEKRLAEQQLRLLSSAVEQSTEGIAVAGLNGTLLFVNNAFAAMHGFLPHEVVGNHISIFHSDEQKNSLEKADSLVQEMGRFQGEIWHTRRDQTVFPGMQHNSLLRNERGVPVGVIYALRDITDQKKVEMALKGERATLARRVEERTAELRRANAELAKASQLKDEFLASMSHELRTPLNAILGMSEALLEEVYGELNEKQIRYLTRVEESGRHLLALINDILDISKIEAGKLTIDYVRFNVRTVCNASLRMTMQPALKKSIKVSSHIDDSISIIQADQRRLKQILVNLLSNAIKFTPEKGSIGLEVRADDEERIVHFTVWDTGIGISQEDLQKLFEPFVQLDSSLARHHAGTGLGLALVRRLVDMHGGGVSVESEVGEGSRFTVSLPWRTGDEAMDIYESSHGVLLRGFLREKSPFAGRKILIADDHEDNINTLIDYLTMKGFQIVVARNGQDAINLARNEMPALILMDIQMPGMDGLEATRLIRVDPKLSEIPVIVVTALAMRGDRERSLAAGANDYHSKPIRLQKLVAAMEHQLKMRETEALYSHE